MELVYRETPKNHETHFAHTNSPIGFPYRSIYSSRHLLHKRPQTGRPGLASRPESRMRQPGPRADPGNSPAEQPRFAKKSPSPGPGALLISREIPRPRVRGAGRCRCAQENRGLRLPKTTNRPDSENRHFAGPKWQRDSRFLMTPAGTSGGPGIFSCFSG